MAGRCPEYHTAGTLEVKRVIELEKLSMVWSVHASLWDAGLEVARSYAAVHGHFLPPTGAVWGSTGGAEGFGGGAGSMAIGVWAKNQHAAARKAAENAARRAAGENLGLPYAGELSEARQEGLPDVDPVWCPVAWEVAWQRCYRLVLAHVKAGEVFPAGAG